MRAARASEGPTPLEQALGTREPGSLLPWLLLVPLVLLTVVAGVLGNGDVWLAVTPVLLALIVGVVVVLPLRAPMFILLVLAWALEVPGDAFGAGQIETPWRTAGALLFAKLNLTIDFAPLVLTGFDLLALLMFGVVAYRHYQRSMVDRAGWVDAPAPIGTFAWLSLAGVGWLCVWGALHGGATRFMLWQGIRWLYLPVVYALMRQALRGMPDAPTIGKLLLGVGLFRGGEAIVFRSWFPTDLLPHATTHADSVLFVTCLAILGALLLEMPSPRTFRLALVLSPLFLWAIRANNRRLAYAELALVAVVFWSVTPWRPLKRKVARVLVTLSLPILLYVGAGWGSQAGVFGPVRKFRSMLDSRADTSTLWRELENFDLVFTFKENPLLGLGLGRPFEQKIELPDVTTHYELEPYIPHNSVVGLWAYGGLLGFAVLWAVFPVGFFFTIRAYRWSRTPLERVTCLGAAAAQVCYLVQGYADLGFGSWGPVFTIATAYALVGKICVANGAWGPARRPEAHVSGPVLVPVPDRG